MSDTQCWACEAGAERMPAVTLAHMPPGWVAFACAKGHAGHIGPPPLVVGTRRMLPAQTTQPEPERT